MTHPPSRILLLILLSLLPAAAQTATPDYQPLPIDRGAPALAQSLRKLATRASLMMITAHPDDEDGGMLAYESRGQGARVALLTLNRGEGGQNVMSNDYWDQLALVRTQELLAAGRYYAVDQYFTRVADFGFSKTLEEALQTWGKERVLYDVVRAVRLNRPLVLTAVFVGGITDGHGQHQVSGEMAQEVFTAAGDPNVFPDQIQAGLLPWNPLKVYARVPTFSISPKGMYDYATGKWAPVRFYDYVNHRWTDAVPTTTLTVREGNQDPILGASYIQIGREGLGNQKSQNGGAGIPLAGPFDVPYHRYGSRVAAPQTEQSFYDGIDVTLPGIATLARGRHPFLDTALAKLAALVNQANRTYRPSQPEKLVPLLAQGLKQTQSLRQQVQASALSAEEKYNIDHELAVKVVQFQTALRQALGIQLTAVVAPVHPERRSFFNADPQDSIVNAVPGQSIGVTVYLNNPSPIPVAIGSIALLPTQPGDWKIQTTCNQQPGESCSTCNQQPGESCSTCNQQPGAPGLARFSRDLGGHECNFHLTIPPEAQPTKACFHRKTVEQSYYDLDSVHCLDRPLPPYPLEAWADLTVEGVTLRIGQVVQTVQHVVGKGAIYQPLQIVPQLSVAATATAGVIPLSQQSEVPIDFRLQANQKTQGTLHLALPPGWQSDPATLPIAAQPSDQQTLTFRITPSHLEPGVYPIVPMQGSNPTEAYQTVGYPGLRPYNYYPAAPYKLVGVDVKLASNLKIGYVMGTGDDVPQSLAGMGAQVHLLQPPDLLTGNLANWDVIVLGIRAYAARPELATANARLLDYVKQGGVLIVQYNTREYDHNYGPYPMQLTGDPEKVVDEANQVQLLLPDSPLLTWPNRLTAADFEGWVEERGHSFMHTWDPHYQALTETHDPGQDQQKGGLLYARYGKGAYIYVAYALYRQLPEGVPGAYRLFANLLSLPKSPTK